APHPGQDRRRPRGHQESSRRKEVMHRSGQVTTCPENLATMRVPKTHRRKGTRNAYWFRKFYMHPTKGRVSVIFEVKGSKAAADKVAREVTLRCELGAFDPYDPYTLLKDQY